MEYAWSKLLIKTIKKHIYCQVRGGDIECTHDSWLANTIWTFPLYNLMPDQCSTKYSLHWKSNPTHYKKIKKTTWNLLSNFIICFARQVARPKFSLEGVDLHFSIILLWTAEKLPYRATIAAMNASQI